MTDRCHVLIAEARFYEDLADQMAAGAIAELDAAGATYTRLGVPGCFELPAAIKFALGRHGDEAGRFDGAIALVASFAAKRTIMSTSAARSAAA